jgi:competence protein ComEC
VTDRATVLLVVAAAGGALVAHPFPVVVAAVVILTALAVRHPLLLAAGVAVAASGLAARSWAGLAPPEPRSVSQTVTLAGDPTDVAGALRVDVLLDGKRVEAWARGRSAGRLRSALAGERVHITGRLAPLPVDQRVGAAPRHVGARLTVEHADRRSAGGWASALANRIRRALLRGAERLPDDRRSLFAGFVLGDDRGQPPEVAFDFRASGLSHLLVVSGQNVAFVLAVAGPLLRRLGLRWRLVAGAGVLVLFGVLTRWEPSVLRAVAMAGLTLLAGTLGRPASTIRVLALAVTGLLLIDPLLVHSIGFRLSAGACAGIALFSKALTRALPGPRPLAEALGVTLAAQVGVAPVLIPVFGGLPVVSLLANVLALPAAGPLMVWGLAAGLPAGLLGGVVAALVHAPTRVLLTWVAGVARVTGTLPLGQLGLVHLALLVVGGAAAVWALRRDRLVAAGWVAVACVAVLLTPAVGVLRPGPLTARSVGRGAALWRAGEATVVVLDGARGGADRLLSGLQNAGVRGLDVLVVSGPGVTDARAAEVVQRRFPARLVLAPARSQLQGRQVPPPGSELRVGDLVVAFAAAAAAEGGDRLAVTVRRADARGPPDSVGDHAADPRSAHLRPGHARPGDGRGRLAGSGRADGGRGRRRDRAAGRVQPG